MKPEELNLVHITIYHVLSGVCGEQVFEDADESKAKARAMELASHLAETCPVTIWRTFELRKTK